MAGRNCETGHTYPQGAIGVISDQDVELVRRLFAAFSRGDGAAAADCWTADGEWWPAYMGGGLIEGTVFRGRERLIEFVELQPETWETAIAEPVGISDLGGRLLVEVQLSAVGRVSGTPVERVTWNVFELRDGKVATGRVYTTKEEALDALGLGD